MCHNKTNLFEPGCIRGNQLGGIQIIVFKNVSFLRNVFFLQKVNNNIYMYVLKVKYDNKL